MENRKTTKKSSFRLFTILLATLIVFVQLSQCELTRKRIEDSALSRSLYPTWAHSHWVWYESGLANQTSLQDLVSSYLIRNVPVGAVDVDSQWATGDTNFIWDTTKYPNATQMIENFHSLGVRVICWVVSLNNVDPLSSSYYEGLQNNYYLNSTRKVDHNDHEGLINWWHGTGAELDYTNPDALDWWHSQMDYLLDIGLDGWKCDGSDPYVMELYPIKSYSGDLHYREFADSYYGDFFNYSVTKNPNALIMSRPVDNYLFVYWSFSPRYVMYSGWVGDQDPDFEGLQDALRNYFHSAWRNYTNFGSDIGGYRSSSDYGTLGRTKELFIRWAQLGAFSPLMENGGNGEHRPWMFDNTNQTLDIYRQFVKFHYELNPYLLNAGTISMETVVPVMYPQANKTDSILQSFHPDSWDYKLWTDILVCPIVRNSTERDVTFPEGDNWVDWWDLSKVYSGGSSSHFVYPLEQFPLFYRQGSLIALHVEEELLVGHGNGNNLFSKERPIRPASSKELDTWMDGETLTLFIPYPSSSGETQIRSFSSKTQEVNYNYDQVTGEFNLIVTPHPRLLLLVIHGVTSPRVVFDSMWSSPQHIKHVESKFDFDLSETPVWTHIDENQGSLWVKLPDSSEGAHITISPIHHTFQIPNAQ